MGIAVELVGLVGKTGGCLLLLAMGSLILAWFWSAFNSSRRLHEAQWQELAQRTGLTTRPGAFAAARVQGQFQGRAVSLDYLFRHWGRNGLFTRWRVALDNPAGHYLALHPAGGWGRSRFPIAIRCTAGRRRWPTACWATPGCAAAVWPCPTVMCNCKVAA